MAATTSVVPPGMHEVPPRSASWGAKLRAPGFYRAFLGAALAVAFATALTWVIRTSTGHATYTHYLSPDAILTVSLIACPLFFLVGLGAFDYWFYWVSGRPTRAESHANHGAYSWKDYFKVNTDHKVIGVQYVVTSFFFLLVGGMIAMLMRIRARAAGREVRGREHLQRPLLGPRLDPDLLLRDPRLRGPRELRAAADDRRARHGLPAPERALLLAAAARRDHHAAELPRARRRVRRRLDRLRAALDRRRRSGRTSSRSACSSRAPPRSPPRSTSS